MAIAILLQHNLKKIILLTKSRVGGGSENYVNVLLF